MLVSNITSCLIDRLSISPHKNNNLLLTEREGRTGEYWPEVVAVRTERSEVRTKMTEGQYSPVRSWASEVSKWFIIWHHFSYETTLPVVHSSQFPARCQGKKPAILTGFRISLMIVAVDRQNCLHCSWMKTALLLLYVSVFRRPVQHKKVLFENTSSLWAETIREKEE